MNERRAFRILVFLAAFCCLMFELIISRLADFHLDSRNSFIAIPITFLGLALGSLHVHFRKQIVERFRIRANLILLAVVSLTTLTLVFFLFTQYLTVVGAYSLMATLQHTLRKSLVFVGVFIIPFYFFGRVLTVCYHLNRERIGEIYSADFFGASLACFLTPVLFHLLNLPGVLFTFTLGVSCLVLLFLGLPPRVTLTLFVPAILLNLGFLYFILYVDNRTNFRDFFSGEGNVPAEEIAHGWNEFSRVSLIRTPAPGGGPRYTIMHDNAQSNVHVNPYVPGAFATAARVNTVEIAFLRGKRISDVLVMFAGCGAEMLEFYRFSRGEARITGVELNPLVKQLAMDTPELAGFKLKDFYGLPNVNLAITEGRSFLVQDTSKYDVIFIGSKAPTSVQLTGHSRKYLDTEEAYASFLDHLKDGGILHFNHQLLAVPIATFKEVFRKRGGPGFDKSAIIFKSPFGYDLLVAPQSFSEEEVQRLMNADPKDRPAIDYAPYAKESGGVFASLVKAPIDPQAFRVTDDRPFDWDLDLQNYRFVPSKAQITNDFYYQNWIKITTLLVLASFTTLFIIIVSLRKTSRPPMATLAYLLITGFCYLLIEVTFMGKLELFLQDLLVSMATTLTVFLLASGLGSLLFQKLRRKVDMRAFPFVVAAVVVVSLLAVDFVTHRLMGLPFGLRIAVVVLLVAPTGICLGMFYPCAVAGLVHNGLERAVPITYGLSTLSSVIGATYAMTFMIRFGFNALIYQAAVGYVILGVLIILYSFLAKRNVFRLET